MDTPKDEAQKQFEHGVENTRLECQPNPLLEQVKARVSAQAMEGEKARAKKGEGFQAQAQVSAQTAR